MATKPELIETAKSLSIETEGLNVAQLTAAIKEASEDEASAETETVEDNPTVKRQKAAKALREENAKAVAKANKEAEAKAAEQKSDAEKAASETPKKDTRKQFTDDRGLKFAFKQSAPKSINIDGKSCKTSEIIENKEVMLELVYGNSNFIEQIY